jgi:hypothetical protein
VARAQLTIRRRVFKLGMLFIQMLEAFQMPRRKQLKGIAGNLAHWCLSRNFDVNGYWAVGQLYARAKASGVSQASLQLYEDFKLVESEYPDAAQSVSKIFYRDLTSKSIPITWVKDLEVIFSFETEYQRKYHYWGSGLGGMPAMCSVFITTDMGQLYQHELGFNVWVHNPKREVRRSGF